MGKLSAITMSDVGQKALVFGPPKVGKTLAAGMLARKYNLIWFDLEHGYLTLKQLPLEYQEKINIIQVPDDKDNYLGITSMLKVAEGKKLSICDVHGTLGPKCVKCRTSTVKGEVQVIDIENLTSNDVVVVDSMSQLSDSAMAMSFKGQGITDIKPEFANYTAQSMYLNRFLTSVQQSKANWVILAHEESIELEEKKKEKIVPRAGTRNFSRNFGKYFDHIVHMSIKNRKYSQNSDGTSNPMILTGSRTGVSLETGVTDGLIQLLEGGEPTTIEFKSVSKEVQEAKVLEGKKIESKLTKKIPTTIAGATAKPALTPLQKLQAKKTTT